MVIVSFSAAAAQNRSLLELLFPQTETTSVSEQLIATNGTMEHVTVSGMNGWDVTPVGVVNDARTIYLIFQIDSHGEKIDSQNMIFLDETKVNAVGRAIRLSTACQAGMKREQTRILSWKMRR